MNDETLTQELIHSNHTFRRLYEEHRKYDERLQDLSSRPYLNQDEDREEKELKKKKLALKDELNRILAGYREQFMEKKSGAA